MDKIKSFKLHICLFIMILFLVTSVTDFCDLFADSVIQVEAEESGLAHFELLTSGNDKWMVSDTREGGGATFTSVNGDDDYFINASLSDYTYKCGDFLSIKYEGVDISDDYISITNGNDEIFLENIIYYHDGYITIELPIDKWNIFNIAAPTCIYIKGMYEGAEALDSFTIDGIELHEAGTLPSWDDGSISMYYPYTSPGAVAVTYYDNIYSRGFTWSTDGTINESALYIIQKSGNMSEADVDWSQAEKINAAMTERTEGIYVKWHIFKAHVSGLTPGAAYFYRVGNDISGYSETGTLEIESDPVPDELTFLHVTDCQSYDKFTYSKWADLLETATNRYPDASFLAYSGDMTNNSRHYLTMREWLWALDTADDTLMNLPIAPASGNHDKFDYSFVDRFDIDYADYISGSDAELLSGGDYYFTYGKDIIFITLNTNIGTTSGDFKSQKKWLRDVLEAHKSYKWKIVQLHKGPISTGFHTFESDTCDLRNDLCPIFSKYSVDLVLQGHDHVYARSASYYFWTENNEDESKYTYDACQDSGNVTSSYLFDGESRIWNLEPEGTHYVTINYSSDKSHVNYDDSVLNPKIHLGINPVGNNSCSTQPGFPMYGVVRIKGDILCYDAYIFDNTTKESRLYDTFSVDKSVKNSGDDQDKNHSSLDESDDDADSKTDSKTENKTENKDSSNYSNEWVEGKWYNADGKCDYAGTLMWKKNETGWWVEDTTGWYPVSQWQKIDGKWYYFLDTGYMDYSEYRDGYWIGADGALVNGYRGAWKKNSKGWWFEDISGWYPKDRWLWINERCYYFLADGYMAADRYIDGYWVGPDGAWRPE